MFSKKTWTHLLSVGVLIFAGSQGLAHAFPCCVSCACEDGGYCTKCVNCQPVQSCNTSCICTVGSVKCVAICSNGLSPEMLNTAELQTCNGLVCARGPAVDSKGKPLSVFLRNLLELAGTEFSSPSMDPNSTVNVVVPEMQFYDWVNAVAKQLNTVPVFRSGERVELIPKGELNGINFSAEASEEKLSIKVTNMDPGSAIREVASAAKTDIVIPEGFNGRFDGDYRNMRWKETIEAILKSSGNKGHVVVAPNGLVQIAP